MVAVPFILLLVGLALVAAEVHLITRHNIIGMTGVFAVLASIVASFLLSGPIVGLVCTATSILAGLGLFIFLRLSGALQRYEMQKTALRSEPSEYKEIRSKYLGKAGIAVTPLRPNGTVRVMGEELTAATEGEFIAQGSSVRVVAMDSRQFFVKLDDTQ